jgi:hypothetical protein
MRAGTALIWVGIAVAVVGAILRWAPWLLSWFGNLPGDIRYQGENSRVFIPITSMIVVSIVGSVALSVLLSLLRRGGT